MTINYTKYTITLTQGLSLLWLTRSGSDLNFELPTAKNSDRIELFSTEKEALQWWKIFNQKILNKKLQGFLVVEKVEVSINSSVFRNNNIYLIPPPPPEDNPKFKKKNKK